LLKETAISELFELAIALEYATEAFYRGLARMFNHEPEVALFWKQYADEEAGHARFLEDLRGKLSESKLRHLADTWMVESARQQLKNSPGQLLEGIRNLEEAYQTALEIENSETNTIFEFLITDFALTNRAGEFLREQLHSHVDKLNTSFPAEFQGRTKRLTVLASDALPGIRKHE
jgi:rubrerythrin